MLGWLWPLPLVLLARFALMVAADRLALIAGARIKASIREALVARLQALGPAFVQTRATGDLAAPTQSGEEKARAVAGYANGRTLVAAFGDTLADVPLLALAQRAIAVAPDAALRRVARDRNWEILEASAA